MKLLPVFLLLVFASFAAAGNVVCFFTSWTVYRNGYGKFDVGNINPSLCTHILYGFVGLDTNNTVKILDPWEALDNGLKGFSNLVALKKDNPDLKILVSMGGWNEGSDKYSKMAADADSRKTFVAAVVAFLKKYDFDGFDFDWEYPGQRDSTDPKNDPINYVLLLNELKEALGPDYILSAAVAGVKDSIDASYLVPNVSKVLDMINVMSYDYHGAFDQFIGHYAPLHPSSLDKTDSQKLLNTAAGMEYWIENGADPKKLNLGLGTYGRGFTLSSASQTDLYDPVSGPSEVGKYTQEPGVLGYNEICELYSDWTYVWDDEQKVPHRVSTTDKQWVGYDDEKSVALKVDYVKEKKLGGVMVWSLDTDDFNGICGDEYPLLTAINKAMMK